MRFGMRISSVWRPVMRVAGVSDESAYVELAEDSLHVVMGKWFDEKLPLKEIAEVKRGEWPWYGGLGVRLGLERGGVGVVGSLEGIVHLRFKSPQKVHVLIAVDCSDLRIALEEPDAFMKTLEEIIAHL